MRKILVKYFALHYYMKIAGKTVYFLRAANVLFPATVLAALVITGNPETWDLYWYDYLTLGGLFLLYWLGLGNFGFTYFGRWPAQYHELEDEEQRLDFLTAVDLLMVKNPWLERGSFGPLPPKMKFEHDRLLDRHAERMKPRWYGLNKLLPLLLSIAAIVGYVIYWG